MTDPLNPVYFPAAVALGALHALEPGHAKALTAAYLIGIKGTKRDSVVLGLSVAATHSLVVIAISAIGLWIGREAFTGQATHYVELGSGLVAIGIGSWMLWRRLSVKYQVHHHEHHHHQVAPVEVQGETGWVILGYNLHFKTLENYWCYDHLHSPAATIPLLVMDMYEHSYPMDYGAQAAKYIDTFFKNIRWDEISRRLEQFKV